MADLELETLTDNQIMEIHDVLLDANRDLVSLASVDTQFVAAQVRDIQEAQVALTNVQQSANLGNLGPLEIALENAENAFYFSFTDLFQSDTAANIYKEAQNISQDTHPKNGQEMHYTEIAGRQYLVPKTDTADNADSLSVAFVTNMQQISDNFQSQLQPTTPAQTNSGNYNAQSTPTMPAQPDSLNIDTVPPAPIQMTAEERLATMSRIEIREALAISQENGGGTYETYKAAFTALNPEGYGEFFEGVENQTSALGINPLQDQLTIALNNDPDVLANMVLYADDPEKLNALTSMVTSDSPDTIKALNGDIITIAPSLADEAQTAKLINSLAEENGVAPHATSAFGAIPLADPSTITDLDAPHNNPEIESFDATIQQRVEEIQSSPHINDVQPTTPSLDETAPSQTAPGQPIISSFQDDVPRTGEPAPQVGEQFNASVLPASANTNAEPSSTYTVKADDTLEDIVENHYGIEDSGMAYRASLIIGAVNDIGDANRIDIGQVIKLPSLNTLQDAAGSDTLRLKNMDQHPTEIGNQIKETLSESANASLEGGHYANTSQVAAAAMKL